MPLTEWPSVFQPFFAVVVIDELVYSILNSGVRSAQVEGYPSPRVFTADVCGHSFSFFLMYNFFDSLALPKVQSIDCNNLQRGQIETNFNFLSGG